MLDNQGIGAITKYINVLHPSLNYHIKNVNYKSCPKGPQLSVLRDSGYDKR